MTPASLAWLPDAAQQRDVKVGGIAGAQAAKLPEFCVEGSDRGRIPDPKALQYSSKSCYHNAINHLRIGLESKDNPEGYCRNACIYLYCNQCNLT